MPWIGIGVASRARVWGLTRPEIPVGVTRLVLSLEGLLEVGEDVHAHSFADRVGVRHVRIGEGEKERKFQENGERAPQG